MEGKRPCDNCALVPGTVRLAGSKGADGKPWLVCRDCRKAMRVTEVTGTCDVCRVVTGSQNGSHTTSTGRTLCDTCHALPSCGGSCPTC